MSKIYVASSLENWQTIRNYIGRINKSGHTITYDWTTHGEMYEKREPMVAPSLRTAASKELDGVCAADYLLLVLPGGCGTHFEFGVAYSLGKQIFIIDLGSSKFRKVSFHYLPGITRVGSLIEFIELIKKD